MNNLVPLPVDFSLEAYKRWALSRIAISTWQNRVVVNHEAIEKKKMKSCEFDPQ